MVSSKPVTYLQKHLPSSYMQITSPCKGLTTLTSLSFPAPEVTTLRLTVVQRGGWGEEWQKK